MMDPVLLHLRVNHFPIVLGLVGAVAAIVAIIRGRRRWLDYAQITLILAALAAPVAYFSGDQALDTLREQKVWYIDRQAAHDHQEAGEKTAIALVITGIIAAISIWKDKRSLRVLLLVAALISAALATYTGLEGGKILTQNSVLLKSPAPPGVIVK